MEYLKAKLIRALVDHFENDDRRIEHALRVLAWTEKLLESEPADREIAPAVAVLHDVGIKEAEAKHGTSSARLQEEYGPSIAKRILANIGFPGDKIEAVCAIVGKHHTKNGVDSPDFRILWDADLLVNTADSPQLDMEKMAGKIDNIFATETGRILARREFAKARL
ncbi:MAG: HD domain-containing protein [Armatimonadota bacterium]|nr:HD domain-containing protein [Armatimonadota bacterium]